jgi:hypothetical protein
MGENHMKITVRTYPDRDYRSVENNNATHPACHKSNTQGDAVGLDYIALTGRGAVLRAESPAYPSPTASPWVIKTTKNKLQTEINPDSVRARHALPLHRQKLII